MFRRTHISATTSQERELRDATYRGQSAWLSTICAWLSAALGVFALYVVLAGYRHSLRLPDVPRPNVGPGFSESLTAAIGALWFGSGISIVALLIVLAALLHSKRRLHTLMFALPALLCLMVVLTQPRWLFTALGYGL
jgi:hypothetical protein